MLRSGKNRLIPRGIGVVQVRSARPPKLPARNQIWFDLVWVDCPELQSTSPLLKFGLVDDGKEKIHCHQAPLSSPNWFAFGFGCVDLPAWPDWTLPKAAGARHVRAAMTKQ